MRIPRTRPLPRQKGYTIFFCVFALIVLSLDAFSQQPAVKFSATSNLVVVDVTVRDHSGKPIENLKKNDFVVLEDGKPQKVSVFEFQKLIGQSLPPLPPEPRQVSVPVVRNEAVISAASPGQIQYQDKRLIAMFFDFSSMEPAEQIRAQDAALKFVNEQMTSSDMVAIMSYASGLRVDQDFTADRDQLRQVIRSFPIGEASDLAGLADTADANSGEDTQAAFTADETEFNIFNTDQKLSALETAARKLALLPEKKALVYFSSGVSKTGVENQSQLRSTINAALKSNVAFYPVDARGLVALVPGGSASQAAPRGTGIFTGNAQTTQRQNFNDQQETLTTLAADTGGKAFLDNNDLSLGIVQAQNDVRSYYILGYYSTNTAEDGRFRRIQVKLETEPRAKLDYRPGYFAPKQFEKFNAADKEHQLEEALAMGDPFTDLPLALEVDYFRLTKDRYFVPVAVKVPGSVIPLVKRGSNETTDFDFIGQVFDEKSKIVGAVRDKIRVKLNETNASQIVRRNLEYDTGFTLSPGKYRIKFLARENKSGKMGTFETSFDIPDLSVKGPSLKLSSVVWGSQREPLASAVGVAEKEKRLLALDPLVQEGQKLVPSITRVFRKKQNLYVYFEVYDPAMNQASKTASVAATLSLFSGRVKAFETAPVHLTSPSKTRKETVPVQLQIPLSKLKPGRYTCQLNVIDELGRKFAFPRAPLVLLP